MCRLIKPWLRTNSNTNASANQRYFTVLRTDMSDDNVGSRYSSHKFVCENVIHGWNRTWTVWIFMKLATSNLQDRLCGYSVGLRSIAWWKNIFGDHRIRKTIAYANYKTILVYGNIIINIRWFNGIQLIIFSSRSVFKKYFALELLTAFNTQINVPIDVRKLKLLFKSKNFCL